MKVISLTLSVILCIAYIVNYYYIRSLGFSGDLLLAAISALASWLNVLNRGLFDSFIQIILLSLAGSVFPYSNYININAEINLYVFGILILGAFYISRIIIENINLK